MKDFLTHFVVPFAFSIIAPLVMVAAACAITMGAMYACLFIYQIILFLWNIVSQLI
jgi:hypothetical protein